MKPQFKLAASLMIAAAAAQVTHPAQAAPSVSGRASASAGVSGPQAVVPGEILVTYKEDASSVRASNVRSFLRATNAETLGSRRIQRLKLPEGTSIAEAIEQLKGQSGVAAVQPNYLYQKTQTTLTPNDPRYGDQWGPKKIQANVAWRQFPAVPPSSTPSPGDPNLIVAVIDTGINYNHDDLKNNMWRNPSEIAGNGRDDDNNGYVDDVFGIDAYANTSDPMDRDGHGTHVAGVIGAVGNNNTGIAGLNFRVKLLGVKVLSDTGAGSSATIIKGLQYIVALKQAGRNIRVANHSYGDTLPAGTVADAAVQVEFDKMGELGILSAVAAGNDNNNNDGSHDYPSSYDSFGVISVAASDSSDRRASFSNYGAETVDIAAPGTSIVSTYPYVTKTTKTYPGGDYRKPPVYTTTTTFSNSGYKELDGTSMAAPHVAGAAALLFAYKPNATSSNVISWIRAGVDVLPQWGGVVKWGGRLNIARSMISAGAQITGVPTPLPTVTPDPLPTATPATAPPAAPTGLTATPGNSQITLNWTAVPGASLGYNIYSSPTAGGTYTYLTNTAGTTFNIQNLTNGVPYYFIVRSMNSLGESGNSNEATATPNGPPAAPLNLTATAGSTQIVLNWTASAGATSYNIYRSTSAFTDANLPTPLVVGVTGTTYTDTSVVSGTYYYRVKAVNGAGTGPSSNQASATLQQSLPAAPTSLTATPGNQQITLNWTAVAGATTYNVYRSLTTGGPYGPLATGLATTTYTDTGRTNGVTYYYIVRAVNAIGEGSQSNEASATPNGPPVAPTNLTATAGDTQVTLNWTASLSATSYNVYRATAPFADGTIANLLVTNVVGTTYVDTDVNNGQIYYYRVKAVNAAGAGPVSNQASATPQAPAPTAPDAPTGLSATAGQNTTINLTWNTVTGATSYNVFRSTTNGTGYTKINGIPVTATTYVDSAVSANVTYYYVVRAVNDAGESANSNQASATPIGYPGAPGSLVAIAGNQQVSLSWGNATGATSYSIYRGSSTGFTPGPDNLIINQVTGNSFTDTGRTNGVTYYYIVRGVNSAGPGPNSNEASATPLPAPPATGGNGDVVYSNGGEIYRITNTGGEAINLSRDPAYDFSPAVNQQDGRVVFVSRLNDLYDLNTELYIMNADGSNQTRLTNNEFDDRDPSWSPDGQWIAFVRDSNGTLGDNPGNLNNRFPGDIGYTPNYDIYIMKPQPENTENPDIGINEPIRITTHEGIDRDPAWSRDRISGKWRLAFTSNRAGLGADGTGTADNDIWVIDFDPATETAAGAPSNVTAFRDVNLNNDPNQGKDDRNPSFSPITFSTITQTLQYRIAYQSDRDGDFEIYTILNNGNGINTSAVPTRITNNGTQGDDSHFWNDNEEIPNGANTDGDQNPTTFDSFGTGGWRYPGDLSGYMSDPYASNFGSNILTGPFALYSRWSPPWDGPGPAPYGMAQVGNDETIEDIDPHFSPDGKWIVFSSNQNGGGSLASFDNDFDLFVIGIDTRGLRRLTKNTASGNGRTGRGYPQDSEPQWGVQVGTGVPPGSVVVTGFSSQSITTKRVGTRSLRRNR